MDWLIFFIRLAITLTFLILSCGGTWALIKLNKFILQYRTAHKILENSVDQYRTENKLLEQRIEVLEQKMKSPEEHHDQPGEFA